jgi:hypothetical protein
MAARVVAIGADPAARLERLALEAAQEWLEWWVNKLAREGRPMTGGWPGTLSEARVRFSRAAASHGDGKGLDPAALELLCRRTYEVARAGWLSRASREAAT